MKPFLLEDIQAHSGSSSTARSAFYITINNTYIYFNGREAVAFRDNYFCFKITNADCGRFERDMETYKAQSVNRDDFLVRLTASLVSSLKSTGMGRPHNEVDIPTLQPTSEPAENALLRELQRIQRVNRPTPPPSIESVVDGIRVNPSREEWESIVTGRAPSTFRGRPVEYNTDAYTTTVSTRPAEEPRRFRMPTSTFDSMPERDREILMRANPRFLPAERSYEFDYDSMLSAIGGGNVRLDNAVERYINSSQENSQETY